VGGLISSNRHSQEKTGGQDLGGHEKTFYPKSRTCAALFCAFEDERNIIYPENRHREIDMQKVCLRPVWDILPWREIGFLFRSVPFRSVPFRSVPFRSVPFRSGRRRVIRTPSFQSQPINLHMREEIK
jgi:hypothetical protein